VLGVLLVRAEVLIGFPDITASSQILVLAAVFGFLGQVLLTRPVDQTGGTVLAAGDPESGVRKREIVYAFWRRITKNASS
jgi:hypothetical protein